MLSSTTHPLTRDYLNQEGQSGSSILRLTEVSVTCLTGITISSADRGSRDPCSWVQGTGFRDGGDQVFIICIAPAPPADLRLATAGNGCPVAQVSDETEGKKKHHAPCNSKLPEAYHAPTMGQSKISRANSGYQFIQTKVIRTATSLEGFIVHKALSHKVFTNGLFSQSDHDSSNLHSTLGWGDSSASGWSSLSPEGNQPAWLLPIKH